jgi:hypothetical protein
LRGYVFKSPNPQSYRPHRSWRPVEVAAFSNLTALFLVPMLIKELNVTENSKQFFEPQRGDIKYDRNIEFSIIIKYKYVTATRFFGFCGFTFLQIFHPYRVTFISHHIKRYCC